MNPSTVDTLISALVPLLIAIVGALAVWLRAWAAKQAASVQDAQLRAALQGADAAVWRAVDQARPVAAALKDAASDGRITAEEAAALRERARAAGRGALLSLSGDAVAIGYAYVDRAIEAALSAQRGALASANEAGRLLSEGRRAEAVDAVASAPAYVPPEVRP